MSNLGKEKKSIEENEHLIPEKKWLAKKSRAGDVESIESIVTVDRYECQLGDFDAFNVLLPCPATRAHSPSVGWTTIYTAILSAGVGLPLHPYFYKIANLYEIAPGQIASSGWVLMAGMYALWNELGLGEPSVDNWNASYSIGSFKSAKYFHHFTFRSAEWGGAADLIEELPSRTADWTSSFLCVPDKAGGFTIRLAHFSPSIVIPKVEISATARTKISMALAHGHRSFASLVVTPNKILVGPEEEDYIAEAKAMNPGAYIPIRRLRPEFASTLPATFSLEDVIHFTSMRRQWETDVSRQETEIGTESGDAGLRPAMGTRSGVLDTANLGPRSGTPAKLLDSEWVADFSADLTEVFTPIATSSLNTSELADCLEEKSLHVCLIKSLKFK